MKKLLFLILFTIFPSTIYAEELSINAKSAILVEASTNTILYEKNIDESLPPASMTKLMTLLITFEHLDKKLINLHDDVYISKNSSSMGGSQVYLEENSKYKLEDLIKAITISSGNDAAVAVAEHISGSEGEFVKLMNKRAKELGLTSTNFVNSCGLDSMGHYSSSRDMSKIAIELLKYPDILKYTSIYEEHLKKSDGSTTWMVNTNKLLRIYNGVDGLKTGYTDNAGYSITATGMFNGMRLIAVVMGDESDKNRSEDVINLFNYGKANYKLNTILKKNTTLGYSKIELGNKSKVKCINKDDISYLEKKGTDSNISYKTNILSLKAPLDKDFICGTLTIYKDNSIYKEYSIYTNTPIKKISIYKTSLNIIKALITQKVY